MWGVCCYKPCIDKGPGALDIRSVDPCASRGEFTLSYASRILGATPDGVKVVDDRAGRLVLREMSFRHRLKVTRRLLRLQREIDGRDDDPYCSPSRLCSKRTSNTPMTARDIHVMEHRSGGLLRVDRENSVLESTVHVNCGDVQASSLTRRLSLCICLRHIPDAIDARGMPSCQKERCRKVLE